MNALKTILLSIFTFVAVANSIKADEQGWLTSLEEAMQLAQEMDRDILLVFSFYQG